MGKPNNHKTTWQNPSNMNVAYSNEGTSITKTENNTTWQFYYYNDISLSSKLVGNRNSIPTGTTIEFEVTQITGSIVADVLDDKNNHQDSYQMSSTGHYKIVLDGTDVKFYKDEVINTSKTKTMDGTCVRFGFVFNAYNESVTFKNFIIYS